MKLKKKKEIKKSFLAAIPPDKPLIKLILAKVFRLKTNDHEFKNGQTL